MKCSHLFVPTCQRSASLQQVYPHACPPRLCMVLRRWPSSAWPPNRRRPWRRGMMPRRSTISRKSVPCPARTLRIDAHMHVRVNHSAHPLSLLGSFTYPELETTPHIAKREQSCIAALSPAGCRTFADFDQAVEEREAALRQAHRPPPEALVQLVL